VRRRRRARARWCEVRVPADEPEAVDLDPGVLARRLDAPATVKAMPKAGVGEKNTF